MKNVLYAAAACLLLTAAACASNLDNSIVHQSNEANERLVLKTDEIVKRYVESNWFSGSVVILKSGEVIYDKSFGFADIENGIANTSNTKIRIGSINKHYTAVLVMQKVQSGQMTLDDTLDKFELGFPAVIAEKITVRHLLRHTSGFADIFNDEYMRTYQKLKTINDKLPLLIDKPLISVPGEKYNYSNYGYIVLGAILEKVENKPFKSIIENNILSVIGAKNTDYALTDQVDGKALSYRFSPTGKKVNSTHMLENLTPDGGMYSTPYDLALFYSKLFYSNELINDEMKAIMGNGYKQRDRVWSQILESDKAKWSSYGGGPGVSAAVEVLIKDKLLVMVLANTDGLVAEHISQRIVDVYKKKEYEAIELPMGLFAANILKDKGRDYLLANPKQIFADAGYKNIKPRPLNKLGFALMNEGEHKNALAVFITNTKLFPNEPNAFDSLAYAYEKAGDKANAIANYKVALSLDSNFKSALEGLARLKDN